jgi:hypothetical protein
MRTTVELRDDQRAALLEEAARRGEKGFSRLVEQALDEWLARRADRQELIDAARSARGALDGDEGEAFADAVVAARRSWREPVSIR